MRTPQYLKACDLLPLVKLTRWQRSPLLSHPLQATLLTWGRSWIFCHNSNRSLMRNLSARLPSTVLLQWGTVTHRWISNSGTYSRPCLSPWPLARRSRREPRPLRNGCMTAREDLQWRRGFRKAETHRLWKLHPQMLWQLLFVWWWKTPTLTPPWVPPHQRRRQLSPLNLPNIGQSAPTLTHPQCVWMIRLWTPLPQVNDPLKTKAVAEIRF